MGHIVDLFVLIVYLAIFAVAVKNKGGVALLNSAGKFFNEAIKTASQG
jgi:hypothetical protein